MDSDMKMTVRELEWGPDARTLCARFDSGLSALRQSEQHRLVRGDISVVELSAEEMIVKKTGKEDGTAARCGVRMNHLAVSDQTIIVSDGHSMETFETDMAADPPTVRKKRSIAAASSSLVATGGQIYTCSGISGTGIEVFSMEGTRLSVISLEEHEGAPVLLDANGDFLAVVTTHHHVRVWNVGGRHVRPQGISRNVLDDRSVEGDVNAIRVAADGSRAYMLARMGPREGDYSSCTHLLVYDVEADSIVFHDFAGVISPSAIFVDSSDARLVAVQTDVSPGSPLVHANVSSPSGSAGVSLLFATPERFVPLDALLTLPRNMKGVVGISVPNILLLTSTSRDPRGDVVVVHPIGLFEGVDPTNVEAKQTLLSFAFHLATGRVDEAFDAVKKISSSSLWSHIAQLCVKTRRVEVAEECLRRMGNIGAVRALREQIESESAGGTSGWSGEEGHLALIALFLGMTREAETALEEAKRYDLLNVMYQSLGMWSRALLVAEKNDRIHLRSTHFLYARSLEASGHIKAAVEHYEKAGVAAYQVPRMYYELGEMDELEKYVTAANSPPLWQWWAQYLESSGDFSHSVESYRLAGDSTSVVRLLCFQRLWDEARKVVAGGSNKAAAFLMARSLEAACADTGDDSQIREAIRLYQMAGQNSQALRIAMSVGADQEVLTLALQSSMDAASVASAASYFDQSGLYDKAASLYHKSGSLGTAVGICIREGLVESLEAVAADLKKQKDADVGTLRQCGEFFLSRRDFDKAVDMFVSCGDFERGIDVCVEKNVKMTENLAERLTLPKTEGESEEGSRRSDLLRKVAKLCKRQGAFHLATKKYTQAGLRLKAMKSLLQSGDVEKIIFFANVSKQREIFIMAANYLQTLEWRKDPQIMKNIVMFYTKAKALDSLSAFYESCAQVEIDEYRDYDRALSAHKEALKYLGQARSGDAAQRETETTTIKHKIFLIEKFLRARTLAKDDPKGMTTACEELLGMSADLEGSAAVRVGDVYALLIEFAYSTKDTEEAFRLIGKMREEGIPLHYYLDKRIVEGIHKAMGVPMPESAAAAKDSAGAAGGGDNASPPEEDIGDVPEETIGENVPEEADGP